MVGGQNAGRDYRPDLPPNIFAFWHRCIIPAAWYFRNRDGVLMNTDQFRVGSGLVAVIETVGIRYGTGKFSTTVEVCAGSRSWPESSMRDLIPKLTIDGRDAVPGYVAKPGPVMLARRLGPRPIILFPHRP